MIKRKYRVMHVIIGSGFGGLEKVVVDLLSGIDRDLFEPYLLCLGQPTLFKKEFEDTGAKVISLGFERGLHFRLPRAIRKVLIDNQVDIVHCHDFKPFLYCGVAAIGLKRCKRVYTEHSSVFSLSTRHFYAIRLLIHVYDLMVMVSEDLCEFYRKELSIVNSKIIVIHNGIEVPSLTSSADTRKLKDKMGIQNELILGTAVRLMEQKGLQYIINALPDIIKKNNNFLLLIIGDGRLREELERQVAEVGVEGHVRFLGYRDDISVLLSVLDIYVLPSLWEGLPLGLIEAMLAEKAIVATRVGGIPEMITDGVHGTLVTPASSSELSSALIELMAKPAQRKEFGRKAAEHARMEFSLRSMVAHYERSYISLLN